MLIEATLEIVLVSEGRILGRYPGFIQLANVEPSTSSDVYVENQEEAQLEQPERKLVVICRIHDVDDPHKPYHSEELQHRYEFQIIHELVLTRIDEDPQDDFKRNG